MMMFSALSVIPLLLLLVLPVVVRHCSSNLIDDAIDFINKAKNKMCETMYINRKSFNVSVDFRFTCGDWPMPDARFELIQMAFFPMPKLPEFLKILEVPDKHICDMLILNGWLSVTDTFPQSPSSAYTVDRVEIFSEKPNIDDNHELILLVKSQCNIFPNETEGCCEHWISLSDSKGDQSAHRFLNASYQGEDEDYIDDHYIGFVTMNPLATTNTSDLRHRTIDLLDVFRRRAELEALGLTVAVEKRCRKVVKKVCSKPYCPLLEEALGNDNKSATAESSAQCYGQDCTYYYDQEENAEVCGSPPDRGCRTTYPFEQLCDWRNCVPAAVLARRGRHRLAPDCLANLAPAIPSVPTADGGGGG